MLHSTLYNGPKIDELLDVISHIKTVVNGWVKLESTEEYPTNLNKLLNPGNFSTDYWTDSPTDTTFSSPLKVIVTKEKNLIRQYIFSTGYTDDGCTRTYNTNNGEISRVTYGNGDYNTYTYDKYGNVASMGINGTTRLKNYADTSGNIVRNEDVVNKLQYNW